MRSFLLMKRFLDLSSQCDHTLSFLCPGLQSELATLLPLSESLAEGGLEPLTIGSMGKILTTELKRHDLSGLAD